MKDKNWLVSEDFWESRENYVADNTEVATNEVTGSILFRTSGSVGNGKLVVLGKKNMIISARAVNEWLGVEKISRWGIALPLDHVGGFSILARVYESGCSVSFYESKWDVAEFGKWLVKEAVTHVSLVPTQILDIVRDSLTAPSGLKVVVVGGGALHEAIESEARELGWPIHRTYGMTETGSQIATQRFVGGGMEVLPIWDVWVEDGLLVVSGDALFTGYVEDGLLKRRQGAFRTNDLVTLDGRLIRFEGRADRLVKVLGVLVDMEKIETTLKKAAKGNECVVVALPNERREHVLAAVFENELDDMLIQSYNSNAPGLEKITVSCALNDFPRSNLGKIQRGKIAEIVKKRYS